MKYDEMIDLAGSVLNDWEKTKADHNLTDEILQEGNRILQEAKKMTQGDFYRED